MDIMGSDPMLYEAQINVMNRSRNDTLVHGQGNIAASVPECEGLGKYRNGFAWEFVEAVIQAGGIPCA
ncbi:hypothetical protein PIB30_046498 [Stylosanthes scabra]|uniref:Uncharacterized protein n=1 Tax=Stylosanthes scabra TaxID=79078 RepID=A0ABU6WJ84_9FABA|nr:hypothetical protein [Stylosanthes scabra]